MGNTVGSLGISNIVRARKNLKLTMTDLQKEVMIGSILGDAYITKSGKIRFEQGSKNKEYIFWLQQLLASVTYTGEPKAISRYYKKYETHYVSFRFSSRQYFKQWRSYFYPCDKKVFPSELRLTPVVLAVWYMDDGCWTGSKAVISIEGFDNQSQTHIQHALKEQHGIETCIGKNRKLVIRKKHHERFFGLIRPHIVASMMYKVPITP